MSREIDASPSPASLLATLSRVGYSFFTAAGDILDNSIAAGAQRVDFQLLRYKDNYRLTICDDGSGMSEEELIANMVVGCKDPSQERGINDLGRFGAGLKSASFSQAQVLTVFSWKSLQEVSAARWDTSLVRANNRWSLLHLSDEEVQDELKTYDVSRKTSGTLVSWEKIWHLDEIEDPDSAELFVGNLLTELHQYIGKHFHRFLSAKFEVFINSRPVRSIDPFMRKEPGYAEGHYEALLSKKGKVEIQAHTLPRPSTLSHEILELHGGAKEITQSQGLYLYRNKRLISGGGWLGVARSSELHNLARIQIDINSNMDEEWQTDVKKSQLSVPRKVRQVLKRISPSPIATSRKTHRYAGKTEEASPLWLVRKNEREGEESVTYLADTKNLELSKVLDGLTEKKRATVMDYLRRLSEELPVKHIYQAFAHNPRGVQLKQNIEDEMTELLRTMKEAGN